VASPRKGTVVDDRYVLVRKIGSGGMADVWLATDRELDRNVAIKILHDRFAQDEEFVERFRREAQAAAGLQHPNVVSVFDRGEFRDTYFIAMEYVDGPTLKELIEGGIGTADAIEFTRQILAATKFAHKKGIIHRDLKPQNVMIDDEGRARVTDFGIARGAASDITEVGSVMGTAQYLSPEQAEGRETDERSDLYSIGVILYEALTGAVPFDGGSAVSVALKQVSEAPQPPSEVDSAVTPALDAVVLRSLAKDPEARFTSADEFTKALDAAERSPDTPRPKDAAVAAASVEGTPPPPMKSRRWKWIAAAVVVAILGGILALILTKPGQVTVPNVTGLTSGAAVVRLESLGLEPKIDPVPSLADRQTVLEQDPLPDSRVSEGSTVTLSVSTGPALVAVPAVAGSEQARAERILEEAGLKPVVERKSSADVEVGVAIGTEPEGGTEISIGSRVTLLISKGIAKSTVPDLTGLSLEAALDALEEADLGSSVVEREDSAPAGQVVSQSPAPGTKVKRGSSVTVFVSSGAVTVPDVVGLTRSAAVKRLKGLGLVPSITPDPTAPVGYVSKQFPPGGSRARRGDTVTISVGEA